MKIRYLSYSRNIIVFVACLILATPIWEFFWILIKLIRYNYEYITLLDLKDDFLPSLLMALVSSIGFTIRINIMLRDKHKKDEEEMSPKFSK
jgi:CDP-diglyceride synthetase